MEGIPTSKLFSLFQPCASLVLAALVSCCVLYGTLWHSRALSTWSWAGSNGVVGTLRSKNEEGKEGERRRERVCEWWKWRRRERAEDKGWCMTRVLFRSLHQSSQQRCAHHSKVLHTGSRSNTLECQYLDPMAASIKCIYGERQALQQSMPAGQLCTSQTNIPVTDGGGGLGQVSDSDTRPRTFSCSQSCRPTPTPTGNPRGSTIFSPPPHS